MATKTKRITKPRITAAQRKDWRSLPLNEWNTATIHAYFIEMNRELFGVDEYLPLRNWTIERALIKRALTEHGAEVLKRAFDECFRTYRPTREYPLLTAGFAISYRINSMIPRIKAEIEREQTDATVSESVDYGELASWL